MAESGSTECPSPPGPGPSPYYLHGHIGRSVGGSVGGLCKKCVFNKYFYGLPGIGNTYLLLVFSLVLLAWHRLGLETRL